MPGRIIDSIGVYASSFKKDLKTYIGKFKPSPDFVQAMEYELMYFPANNFLILDQNIKYKLIYIYPASGCLESYSGQSVCSVEV